MDYVEEHSVVRDRTSVGIAMKDWSKSNGKRDPRLFLDQNYHSVRIRTRFGSKIAEMSEWCKKNMPEDYFNMFDKFWFTNDEQLTLFILVWGE